MKTLVLLAITSINLMTGCFFNQEENTEDCIVTGEEIARENKCNGHFHYDSNNPELVKKAQAFQKAAAEWNAYIGKDYVVIEPSARVNLNYGIELASNMNANCEIYYGDRGDSDVWASYKNSTGDIMINLYPKYEANEDEFIQTMMHEIGHSFGMVHAKSGLMCSTSAGYHPVNETTMEACEATGVCQ